MAKDPAFLFYPNDWLGGTMTLTRHQKGCYIDLLVAQFNSGPLSLEKIKTLLGADYGSSWPTLQEKFTYEEGRFFNERLETEKVKRRDYVARQSENGRKGGRKASLNPVLNPDETHRLSNVEDESEDCSIVSLTRVSREVFFKDLPNSQELEIICRDLHLTKEQVLERVPNFRKAAEVDYPNFQRFCGHLKNWIRKNPIKGRGVVR